MASDWELLERYAGQRDQAAFRELVARHVDLIYGEARRILGGGGRDPEDVVQAVFWLLAQKAGRIHASGALAGWLFRTTRYCCANLRTEERRRRRREREAGMQRHQDERRHGEGDEEELLRALDEAISRLGEKERQAILVRYLQGKTAEQTGAVLGVSVEAVEKRVERGIGKLRALFARKGFVMPAAGVAGVMAAESAKAAPAGLGAAAAGTAAAGGGSAASISLAKGTTMMMKLTSLKMAAMFAGLLLTLVMGAGLVVKITAGAQPPTVAATAPASEPAAANVAPKMSEQWKSNTYEAVVRDSDGKPVAGAKVRLERTDWDRPGMKVEAETVTGADGKFTLGPVEFIVPHGLVWRTITVDAPGWAWGWWDGRKGDPFDEQFVPEITLKKAAPVAGTVTDEAGKPVPGASVSLGVMRDMGGYFQDNFGFSSKDGRAATTDDQGHFVVDRVPAGTRASIGVEHAGFVTYSEGGVDDPPIAAGARDVHVVLQRGAQVTVQLARGDEDLKKAGVIVAALQGGMPTGAREFTDDNGQATWSGLKPGTYTFRADGPTLAKDDLAGVESAAVIVKAGEKTSVRVPCVAGRTVRVRVEHEEKADRRIVWIYRPGRSFSGEFVGEPGPDGLITLPLAPGNYMISTRGMDGFTRTIDGQLKSKSLIVEEGKEPLDVTIKIGGDWHGRLVDERGGGVEGFVVWWGQRIATGADGRFAVEPEPEDTLGIAWDRQKKRGRMFLMEHRPGEERKITMERMGEVRGFVELPEGHHAKEVTLSLDVSINPDLSESWTKALWQTEIGEAGDFRIWPVPVGMNVRVEARMKGYEGWSGSLELPSVPVEAGESIDVGNVSLSSLGSDAYGDPRTWDAVVRGRVVDEKGEVVKGMRVGLGVPGGPGAISDLEGRFELKGMPRGKVTLSTPQNGIYRPAEVAVESPAEGVEVKITPQGWELLGKEAPEVVVDRWVNEAFE